MPPIHDVNNPNIIEKGITNILKTKIFIVSW
jgi:hypothetical protein